jgi:hypothetical protein
MDKTNRGFDYHEFKDRYGDECSLQKSSLATEDCIWFGINEAKPRIMACHVNGGTPDGWVDYPLHKDVFIGTRMHLTQDMVKAMLPALLRFVETGELEEVSQ